MQKALKHLFPNISFETECIIVDDGSGPYIAHWNRPEPQPTQAEIAVATLPAARSAQIDKLKAACKLAIEAGFQCDALGATHTYDSALPQDQINIIGSMVAALGGSSVPFTCTDANGYKQQRLHTAAQLQQVFTAGMTHIVTQKTKYDTLKKQVEQATDVAAVEAVVW